MVSEAYGAGRKAQGYISEMLNWDCSLQGACQQGGNLKWEIHEFLISMITNVYACDSEWILEILLPEYCSRKENLFQYMETKYRLSELKFT